MEPLTPLDKFSLAFEHSNWHLKVHKQTAISDRTFLSIIGIDLDEELEKLSQETNNER